MTLTHAEFIRRFSLPILLKRFTSSVRPLGSGVKIWHYGFFEQHLEATKAETFTGKT
jgi:hypothetical protein